MTSKIMPKIMRKIVATRLSQKFKDVVKIVEAALPLPGEGDILIRNRYLGINASDINYTAGRYDVNIQLPLDCGFEGIGEVIVAGKNSLLKVGQPVMYLQYGAFSEYKVVSARRAIPLPSVKAEFLPLFVSGLTAAICLDKLGELKKGETILVTAAAGGTGQFAVQWAKRAGCHVIGTCSTDEKVTFLQTLGCDRPVNYKKEDLKAVLKNEYPKGIDVIYESVGGEMFDLCVNSLAVKGRLLVIGFMTGYESDTGFKPSRVAATLPVRLLKISGSVRGFFLEHYVKDWAEYGRKLIELHSSGEIKCFVNNGEKTPTGPFIGLEKVVDAVEYLHSGQSMGKVVVEIPQLENQAKL